MTSQVKTNKHLSIPAKYENSISILTNIFIRYSGYTLEFLTLQNRAQIQAQLRRTLQRDGKLDIVLPAFPYKSINRTDKVAGPHADAGEYAALKTLASLCDELNQHVTARLFIVSDGHVFNDLHNLSDSVVDSYFQELQNFCCSPHIFFLRLHDFLGDGPAECHRNQLLRDFAQSDNDIDHRLATVESDLSLYRCLKRFMTEEQVRLPNESRVAFEKRCGRMAKNFFQRSDAYSKMLAIKMPNALRLSIHPRNDWSEKIPIRLVPSADRWATPWHNVAVVKRDGHLTLMHKKIALQQGCIPEFRNKKIWRFLAPY